MIPIREPHHPPEAAMPQSSMAALVEPELTRPSKMDWWYRLAAPSEPALSASLKQREAYRRGKLISIALLLLIGIITVVLFTVGVFVNHGLIPNLVAMLGVLTTAVLMNRRGKVI